LLGKTSARKVEEISKELRACEDSRLETVQRNQDLVLEIENLKALLAKGAPKIKEEDMEFLVQHIEVLKTEKEDLVKMVRGMEQELTVFRNEREVYLRDNEQYVRQLSDMHHLKSLNSSMTKQIEDLKFQLHKEKKPRNFLEEISFLEQQVALLVEEKGQLRKHILKLESDLDSSLKLISKTFHEYDSSKNDTFEKLKIQMGHMTEELVRERGRKISAQEQVVEQ